MNATHSVQRKALLQERTEDKVRCLLCERRCLIVAGGKGWCQTRFNQNGVLYTSIYGAVSSLSANPIEKKPLYHFYPGSRALTAGSWSCNFGCPWCQNWDISKSPPPERSRFLSPEAFIQETTRRSCRGTSISFNEPTLSFDWSLDVFQLAREHNLYNTFVTNGYMTAKALEMLFEAGLDAMNVDIKGNSAAVKKYCKGIDVDQVWARCEQARELGLHLEITTLIIPSVNDDDDSLAEIANRIVEVLGDGIPWHVSGYYPAYRFTVPPTPISTLERAWAIGKEAGLNFIYVGNVPGHPKDNTYCPSCNELLVERIGLLVKHNFIENDRCQFCGEIIPGVGWNWSQEEAPVGM
jgi:pyruvate formate lyase activating enzyme